MNLSDLIGALMTYDALSARQWVADARRAQLQWSEIPRPEGLNLEELAVSAGTAELLAHRMGQSPPSWTQAVAPSPTPVYLVRAAITMKRLKRLCELEGPEPLRRRHVLAPPDFLTIA